MRKITLLFSLIVCVIFAQAQTKVTKDITSIYSIQYTENDASPLVDQTVTISGTVVGIYTSLKGVRQGFYVQDAPGAWNGIYVYYGSAPTGDAETCAIGDSVTVSGTIVEYNGLTELGTITACATLATSKSYTINEVTTGDATTEKWESCIVKVSNATCGSSPSAGNFMVNDGSGDLDVYKQLYQDLALETGTSYNVTGIITWYKSGSMYEIIPRSADDISIVTGFNENLVNKFSATINGGNLLINNATSSTVEIYSALGSKVMTSTIESGKVSISNLSKGLYIVRVGKNIQKIML
ncbi:MAG: T9SS type A sorting domain-containing protein [Paludibacter sp.]|nr:T9SS type A sorting domain-containing protein [Paludibacter sp.]